MELRCESSADAHGKTVRRRGLPFCALLTGAAAMVVFVRTLAPTVTAEDSGELVAAAWHFGIAHPPGYPLWTMLCGAFLRLVAFGDVAWRANLFSAVCSAAAAMVAYAALRELALWRPACMAAALVWVFGRWSWSQSVITEVYPLNSLATASLLWCVLRWRRTKRNRCLLAAALLWGLGMANHHVIGLAGAALVAWVVIQQPDLLRRGRLVIAAIGFFAAGLLPYVYLPIRAAASPAINWGDPSTGRRFIEHVTRHQYGTVGPMKTVEGRSLSRFSRQVVYVGGAVIDDLTWPLTLAALLGAVAMVRRDRALGGLIVLWLMSTGLLFALLANFDFDRTSQWAMRVFLIPVSLGLVVPLAFLLDALHARMMRAARRPTAGRAVLLACIVLAGPVGEVAAHFSECDYSNYWYAHDHARNLLDCMLPGAIVFPSGDHNTFPLVYLTLVEGVRSDVLVADIYGYISPDLYADRPDDATETPEAWIINRAHRPVYYTTKKPPPVANARFVVAGGLYHLLPNHMTFDNAGLRARLQYRNLLTPTVIDLGASNILCDYHFFVGLDELDKGNLPAAQEHFAEAARVGAGIREIFNNIGSALGEHGYEEASMAYYAQAAAIDFRYATPRWNLYRIHRRHGRYVEARKQLEELCSALPDDPRPFGELGFLLRDHFDDLPGAVAAWRRSLALNPNQPQIREALAAYEPAKEN